ncbi:MAG: MBL fold metallo-hydrolase [Blautia sp.]|nr:MBL fold metallo-hydrolase [Blautia sp.]
MDTNTADIIASCGAQVIPMNEDTWRIEDGEVRFFLLKGTEKALLIDTGMTIRQPKEIASALTDLPVMLLNTHADRDHIGGNDQFESFYMNPADEAQYSASGKGGRIIPVRDGDEIDLGNRKLRIIHLPGHTPGSIAVLDVSRRVLLSGDPIQEHGRIFMFGEHRNLEDYIRSLEKLETMVGSFDEIWPSHADLPIFPDCISRLCEAAERILGKEVQGHEAELFGKKILVYDMGFTTFLCDE